MIFNNHFGFVSFSCFLSPKTLPNCPDRNFLSRQSPQKPFQTARTGIFYPGKARQTPFSWIQVHFRPISRFSDFRFLCAQGSWSSDFWFFGVRGLSLKAITSKTSPPGGRNFQKRHPSVFQEQGGSGFPKNLANHLLLVLKSAQDAWSSWADPGHGEVPKPL